MAVHDRGFCVGHLVQVQAVSFFAVIFFAKNISACLLVKKNFFVGVGGRNYFMYF